MILSFSFESRTDNQSLSQSMPEPPSFSRKNPKLSRPQPPMGSDVPEDVSTNPAPSYLCYSFTCIYMMTIACEKSQSDRLRSLWFLCSSWPAWPGLRRQVRGISSRTRRGPWGPFRRSWRKNWLASTSWAGPRRGFMMQWEVRTDCSHSQLLCIKMGDWLLSFMLVCVLRWGVLMNFTHVYINISKFMAWCDCSMIKMTHLKTWKVIVSRISKKGLYFPGCTN